MLAFTPETLNSQLTLTEDQARALSEISSFLSNPNPNPDPIDRQFLLGGYAGVGKSTIIFLVIRAYQTLGKRIAITAPTHKALNQLRAIAFEQGITNVDFMTIHALLGLGIRYENSKKVLTQVTSSTLHLYDLVVIDEGSMIGKDLWNAVQKQIALAFTTKIIHMGDPAQLRPVQENRSPVFKLKNRIILKQVIRQKEGSHLSQFIAAARKAATQLKHPVPFQPFSCYSPNKQDGALLISQKKLIDYAQRTFLKSFEKDPNRLRILAWTNKQVDFYNQIIRNAFYGKNNPDFVIGERLITRNPVLAPNKTILLNTSTEFVIQNLKITQHEGFKAWQLTIIIPEDSSTLPKQIFVLHRDDRERFEAIAERLKQQALKQRFYWRHYYAHIETFAQVRPCFALTVHNAQGSTFKEVAIDSRDLAKRLRVQDEPKKARIREFNSLWYTASSRPRSRCLITTT